MSEVENTEAAEVENTEATEAATEAEAFDEDNSAASAEDSPQR